MTDDETIIGSIIDDARRLVKTLESQLAAARQEAADGTAELRRYVEANGFAWCDEESTVFNVTTALGWMGGALATQKETIRKLLTVDRVCELYNEWLNETDDTANCDFDVWIKRKLEAADVRKGEA